MSDETGTKLRQLLDSLATRPQPSCPACGDRFVSAAVAPPGQRERAIYLRCSTCGRERDDLEFYEA